MFRCFMLYEPCWSHSSPLNSVGMPYYDSLLLSSWTPKFLPNNLFYPPPAKIPSQIEQSIKVTEFVAYATMPKELQGKRNVVLTGPKNSTARFRSGKSRLSQVRLATQMSLSVGEWEIFRISTVPSQIAQRTSRALSVKLISNIPSLV